MTSYHSSLIKISLPPPLLPSFTCQWQINIKLNKHLLCQLILNTNITASHTHVSQESSIPTSFFYYMCVYVYNKYKDMFRHKKFRLIYFSKDP